MSQYINEKELAKNLSLSVQTLRNLRHTRKGFPYYKMREGTKSAVRYDWDEIQTILSGRRIDPAN